MTEKDIPVYRCEICQLNLQSRITLQQHQNGKKHWNREYHLGLRSIPFNCLGVCTKDTPIYTPVLEETEFFTNLQSGRYQNIIILTGAGISTSAGIPDYRSLDGCFRTKLLEMLLQSSSISVGGQAELNRISRFSTETLLSRTFFNSYPDTAKHILSCLRSIVAAETRMPTITHRFCSYLAQQGWLRRIYTQNVDGLHNHPSLSYGNGKSARAYVVECHGSLRQNDMMLYGDNLSRQVFAQLALDFGRDPSSPDVPGAVDLVLVLGTSLRVAPINAVPNLASKRCHRVWVDRSPSTDDDNSMQVHFSKTLRASSQNFWMDHRKARRKRWRQMIVESDCDDFFARVRDATAFEY